MSDTPVPRDNTPSNHWDGPNPVVPDEFEGYRPRDSSSELDAIDEIVLKPAQWQYDDYLKAKAKLQRLISQEAYRLASEVIGEDEPEITVRDFGDGSKIVQINPRNQLRSEQRLRLDGLRKEGES